MIEAAQKLIVENMEKILSDEKAKDAVLNVPYEQFKALCKRDDLKIQHETNLLDLVKNYIEKRCDLNE